MKPDTPEHYGTVSRLLHWLMAALFALILATVILWNSLDMERHEWVGNLFGLHKSLGFILMVLIVLRILWAAAHLGKRPPADNTAVKLGHRALYALMLAVPLIGMIRQYGGGRGPLKVFGIEVMQGAGEKIAWMAELGNNAHGKIGWLLFALAAGHIVMVAVHKLRGHDVLPRMLGR
ncbi:MAG: cytochrome b [Neisseria sp.]|nr:cytochrome b [Neisseria sp.]